VKLPELDERVRGKKGMIRPSRSPAGKKKTTGKGGVIPFLSRISS